MSDGLIGLSEGIKGFAQGMMDAEDRRYKRMEMEAKMKAQAEDKERQRMMDRFEMKKAGFLIPDGDEPIDPAKLQYDPAYLELQKQKSMMNAMYDPYGSKQLSAMNAKAEFQNKMRPTEGELASAAFAKRVENAEGELKRIMGEGFDPTSSKTMFNEMLGGTSALGRASEQFKDPKVKAYQQAKNNFVSAVLRKESGAAISPQEYASEERKYFPQPGDSPEVLKQKEMARLQAIENLKAMGGRAYGLIPSVGGLLPKGKIPKNTFSKPETKVWEGVTYIKKGDKWVAQGAE